MNFHRLFITAVLIVLSLAKVFSQDYFIRVDLIGPLATQKFNTGFEINISDSRAFIINADLGRYMHDAQSMNGQPFWNKSLTGFSIFPEYRFYPFSNSFNQRPQGMFYGLYARYMNLFYMLDYEKVYEIQQGKQDITETAHLFGLGTDIGYKLRKMDGRFYFEILAGLGWGYSTLKNFKYDSFPNESLLWRYELSVGYCF
jgi:hypothetical protein